MKIHFVGGPLHGKIQNHPPTKEVHVPIIHPGGRIDRVIYTVAWRQERWLATVKDND